MAGIIYLMAFGTVVELIEYKRINNKSLQLKIAFIILI